jgi:hypothetical protein
MFIEMAMDMLKKRDQKVIASESKEFHCLGPARMSQVREILSTTGIPEDDPGNEMLAGYLLGLETARTVLAMNAIAVKAGVTF